MKFLDTITATHYIQTMPNSSTNAILVICNDGKEYVLKHSGNTQSVYGSNILISEYLSYLIAKRFNLPIPEYRFIKATESFIGTIEDEEIHGILKSSQDLCIGSVFIHGALPFKSGLKLKNNSYRTLFKTIFGLDQYLYNADRFPENPNLLFIPQTNTLMVIDHSLAIWPILDDYEDNLEGPVRAADKHVLFPYAKGDLSYIGRLIKDIYDVTIQSYIDTIPVEWLNEDLNKEFLKAFFTVRRDNIGNILHGGAKCRIKKTDTSLNLF